MFFNKLIVLQILSTIILTIQAIKNKNLNSQTTQNYKTLQAGTIYLNSERPLWILQDQKDEQVPVKSPPKEEVSEATSKICNYQYYNKQQQQQQPPPPAQRNFKTKAQARVSNKGIQLPQNYIPFQKANPPNLTPSSRRYQNSKFIQNMPVFDALPGDDSSTKSRPIFIYSGHKARMLLNTMLSRHKYPMQEPVPGQVLYPPQALVFKPKTIVANLQRKLNVTMIPFYAHEAIDAKNHNQPITISPSTATSSVKPAKKHKKAKQYAAYHSPDQILSKPATAISQYSYHIEHTTDTAPTLEKPYANHRFQGMPITSTTPLPHKKFEVTYNDGEEKFQITYEDDAAPLERPLSVQTTQAPLPYQSYAFDNNYYAFPVYSMAKLMENRHNDQRVEETNTDEDVMSVERERRLEKPTDNSSKKENDSLLNNSNEDTWFILNSKYKGPLKANTNNLHSSKYIQTSPVKMKHDATNTISLYDENVNIM